MSHIDGTNYFSLRGDYPLQFDHDRVLIGYARCFTDEQDLTAQRDRLRELDIPDEWIYLDHGLTGTHRKRPGLDQALAAVRGGDTLAELYRTLQAKQTASTPRPRLRRGAG